MRDSFDLREYLTHLARRWKTFVLVPLVAVAVAVLVSLLLPKKYDATVTLLIQPGVSDPRFPQALNQVYLEYLRSYEYVLQGDDLIARVLKEFQLDRPPYNYSVAGFRSSVLDVQLLRFSKLLSVRVRFGDPQKAHDIALFLAREAVRTTDALRESETERSFRQFGGDLQSAQARFDQAEKALEDYRRKTREEEWARLVQVEMENKSEYQRQLAALQVQIPELEARAAAGRLSDGPAKIGEADLAAARAKQAALRRSLAELERPLSRHQAELAGIQTRASELERLHNSARNDLQLAMNRVNEARLGVASRTEQLSIADPGIVPQGPSSPHVRFNAMLALALGLLAAVLYETWNWKDESSPHS